jgi:hypothetical protein
VDRRTGSDVGDVHCCISSEMVEPDFLHCCRAVQNRSGTDRLKLGFGLPYSSGDCCARVLASVC